MSVYSYNKIGLIWYKDNDSSQAIDLSDYVNNISPSKTFQPSNNKVSIELFENDLVYNNGVFLPQEGDKMFVYAKEVTMANDTALVEDDIIWNGKFVDYTRTETVDNVILTFSILDWGYDVFNVFNKESYVNAGYKTNEIIIRIIQTATENDDRTFRVDTSNVASLRNNGSSFPVISYVNVTKPVYEILNELGQTNWTNGDLEDVIKYPMVLDFRGSKVYWTEQSLIEVLTIDDNTVLNDITFNTNHEQSANRLILEVGEDLNGDPIHTYITDDKSTSAVVKESFKSEVKLAGKNNDYDNAYNQLRASGLSNADFIVEARKLAKSFAKIWFETIGRKKPEVKVTMPRVGVNLGELVKITRKKIPNNLYRVIGITENINNSTWTSTLTMESFEV